MNDTPHGITPQISCPLCPVLRGEPRRLVAFGVLRKALTVPERERWLRLSASCLAFFCGGCHTQKQLQVAYSAGAMVRLRRAHEAHIKAAPSATSSADVTTAASLDDGAASATTTAKTTAGEVADESAAEEGAAAAASAPSAAQPPACWQSGVRAELARPVVKGHKVNTFEPLPAELKQQVSARWARFSKAWGYEW